MKGISGEMMTRYTMNSLRALALLGLGLFAGCSSCGGTGMGLCDFGGGMCDSSEGMCDAGGACQNASWGGGWGTGANWQSWRARMAGRWRSRAIPEQLPLGVINRAHYQAMETNAEAVDFILYDHDFVLNTAELTSDGKDKILEIAARMRSAPFPVIVERSENNSDPELDAYRRNLIAQILTDLGNPDADQRTVVSTAYGPGYNSIEAQRDWYLHIGGGGGGLNQFGGGFGGGIGGGFGGGFGGGGF